MLGRMCGLAGEQIGGATEALVCADLACAEQVITTHERLRVLNRVVEDGVVRLLSLQAPVARDLRTVVSCLRNAADAERMGALAVHVAKVARRRHPARAVPEGISGYFGEMGRLAVDLSAAARQAVLVGDPVRAAHIGDDDAAMDDVHRQLFTVLSEQPWPYEVATAVDVTLLGRFYERFADHAVRIGRHVVFEATGRAAPS